MLFPFYGVKHSGDLVGVVDGVDWYSEVFELLVAVGLDGSGFLAWGLEFGEGNPSSGEDDESVGQSVKSWAYDFYAHPAQVFHCLVEFLFYVFFSHVGLM